MMQANVKEKSTFTARLKDKTVKCYKTPNHGEDFSEYREQVSIFHFCEYLSSLRRFNDFEISGGAYIGY